MPADAGTWSTSTSKNLPETSSGGVLTAMTVDVDGPTQVGGLTALRDDGGAMTPRDCAGVTHAGYRQTYEDAPVRQVVRRMWSTPPGAVDGLSVTVAVAELGSASSAQSWYRTTADRWRHCQGVTVNDRVGSLTFIQNIDQVLDSGGMLTAQVEVTTSDGTMSPSASWRALNAASQFLVDVEIFRIGARPDPSNADAPAIAHLLSGRLG